MSDDINSIKNVLQNTNPEKEIQQDTGLEMSMEEIVSNRLYRVESQIEAIVDILAIKNIITEQEYNFAFTNVIEYTPDNLKNEKDFNEFLTKRRLNLIQILKRAGLE